MHALTTSKVSDEWPLGVMAFRPTCVLIAETDYWGTHRWNVLDGWKLKSTLCRNSYLKLHFEFQLQRTVVRDHQILLNMVSGVSNYLKLKIVGIARLPQNPAGQDLNHQPRPKEAFLKSVCWITGDFNHQGLNTPLGICRGSKSWFSIYLLSRKCSRIWASKQLIKEFVPYSSDHQNYGRCHLSDSLRTIHQYDVSVAVLTEQSTHSVRDVDV
jgi:hypothetical protein